VSYLVFYKIHINQQIFSNLILHLAGLPPSSNNCGGSGHSRKAMSELGRCDSQQPTTGNSLPPNNPPPSSASVPHTPAGTLRRGHRNLQLLRPQVRCHRIYIVVMIFKLYTISLWVCVCLFMCSLAYFFIGSFSCFCPSICNWFALIHLLPLFHDMFRPHTAIFRC
jgi:hypothetical protein